MRNLRSPSLNKKRRKRLILRVLIVVFLLSFLIGTPTLLSRISGIQIRDFEVKNAVLISQDEIVKLVKENSSGRYFYLFPKSNIVLFPQKHIEENILKKFPRVERVDISFSSLHSALILISERKPVSMWCDGNEKENCFFVDATGYVFDKAPELTESVYFTYRGSLADDPVGKYVLSTNQFLEIQNFVFGVKTLGLDSKSITILAKDEYKLEIAQGGEIYFIFKNGGVQTLSNLESVLKDSDLSLVKDRALTVSAIDLRYGNKVILKK